MDLARRELQGAGAVQRRDLARQVVLGAQVSRELPRVVLLDHEHLADALQCGGRWIMANALVSELSTV